jgi:hypothetical protein
MVMQPNQEEEEEVGTDCVKDNISMLLEGLRVKNAVATWEFGYQLSNCCMAEENHGNP